MKNGPDTDVPADRGGLDAEQRATWQDLVAVIMLLPQALDSRLQAEAGLAHFEYAVLAYLSTSTGREARISEIARLTNGALPRLSKVIDRCEGRGWVTRRPDPTDGRFTLAALTDAGWSKVEEAAPGHVAQVQRLVFDRLTPGQGRQLHRIARTLAEAARGEATSPGRPR